MKTLDEIALEVAHDVFEVEEIDEHPELFVDFARRLIERLGAQEPVAIRNALWELVKLKDAKERVEELCARMVTGAEMKERKRLDEYYKAGKEQAWKAAREALAATVVPPSKQEPAVKIIGCHSLDNDQWIVQDLTGGNVRKGDKFFVAPIVRDEIPEGCTPADAAMLRKANYGLAMQSHELETALADLSRQIHEFAEKYGEADFYTGDADALLARINGLTPNPAPIVREGWQEVPVELLERWLAYAASPAGMTKEIVQDEVAFSRFIGGIDKVEAELIADTESILAAAKEQI